MLIKCLFKAVAFVADIHCIAPISKILVQVLRLKKKNLCVSMTDVRSNNMNTFYQWDDLPPSHQFLPNISVLLIIRQNLLNEVFGSFSIDKDV